MGYSFGVGLVFALLTDQFIDIPTLITNYVL